MMSIEENNASKDLKDAKEVFVPFAKKSREEIENIFFVMFPDKTEFVVEYHPQIQRGKRWSSKFQWFSQLLTK